MAITKLGKSLTEPAGIPQKNIEDALDFVSQRVVNPSGDVSLPPTIRKKVDEEGKSIVEPRWKRNLGLVRDRYLGDDRILRPGMMKSAFAKDSALEKDANMFGTIGQKLLGWGQRRLDQAQRGITWAQDNITKGQQYMGMNHQLALPAGTGAPPVGGTVTTTTAKATQPATSVANDPSS